jgi:hypothetical protein
MPPLDGCDTMEIFLNLLWVTIATAGMLSTRRRSRRVALALGCLLALLFPIISVSDDLLADRNATEEALALVVEAVILAVGFVALANVQPLRTRPAALYHVPLTDPRSPPPAA